MIIPKVVKDFEQKLKTAKTGEKKLILWLLNGFICIKKKRWITIIKNFIN